MSRILPLLAATIVSLMGCSSETEAPKETHDAPANAEKAAAPAVASLPRSEAPSDARVFFLTPGDGDTVQSPVGIEFGIENMSVAPAGQDTANTGHHHLIINADLPPLDRPIPANDNYRHFGDGSTSVSLDLEPGTYTLQMLLGDHLHIPHDPAIYSDPITITVE